MEYIGVIDCNNFFVSCERLFRPDLRQKPVLVMSGNDGCVVARSQEVKDIGVAMGVPIFQIKDIIKDNDISTFSSNFVLYRDVSKRVFSVVKTLLPTMVMYSIDEAFFCFSAPDAKNAAERLRVVKNEIERRVGIPVSIGVAATKTQAKYANRMAKKSGGVVVLESHVWEGLMSTINLSDIWGVGGNLTRRYREAGLLTVGALCSCRKARVEHLFGLSGVRLQAELMGTSVYRVDDCNDDQKSIMSSRSFEKNVTELAVLKDAVAHHIRHIVSELRHMKLRTTSLSVSIKPSRHGDYVLRGGTIMEQWSVPTNSVRILLPIALRLVDDLYEGGVPYKKAGVLAGMLISDSVVQESLFEGVSDKDDGKLETVISDLNIKFGSGAVVIGRQTKAPLWQPKSTKRSPAYTTKWSDIVSVRADI
jgi:DNA polymerase V